MLLFSNFSDSKLSLQDQYNQQYDIYHNGGYWILQNNINVFGPYPKNDHVPWDISDIQKVAQSNKLKDVLKWINTNIVLRLGKIDRGNVTLTTYGVLLRIATGMLNKTNIPPEYKTIFHANMVQNIKHELNEIIEESLPF